MRNRINSIALLACLALLLLPGCIIWDAGYTPNKPVQPHAVPETAKVPITFSVAMQVEREGILAIPTEQSLNQKISKALVQTGLFSKVYYSPENPTGYHVVFNFHQAGETMEEAEDTGMLSGLTLFIIPTWHVVTFDGAAIVTLKGKPVFTSAKAEEIRCIDWLPLLPFGLFMNSWTIWPCIERGVVNALVNDIAAFHEETFVKKDNRN